MSEWISVDKMPIDGECVDVWAIVNDGHCCGDAARISDCFYSERWQSWWKWADNGEDKHFLSGFSVTHWMPLPNPPDAP